MSPNLHNVYGEVLAYAEYAIRYQECRWWQFIKKQMYRDAMWSLYPIVKNKLGLLDKITKKI